MSAINAAPVEGIGDAVAMTTGHAAVGGLAMAANGQDMRDGLLAGALSGAAMSLYSYYTSGPLDPAPGGEPYCKGTPGLDCSAPEGFEADPRLLDRHRNNIGRWNPDARLGVASGDWSMEGSAFMRGVNQIPGMNAMSYFHDIWSVEAGGVHPVRPDTRLGWPTAGR